MAIDADYATGISDRPDGDLALEFRAVLRENSAAVDAMMAAAETGQQITMTVRDLRSPSPPEGLGYGRTDATAAEQQSA
jgi:hypothetical protein